MLAEKTQPWGEQLCYSEAGGGVCDMLQDPDRAAILRLADEVQRCADQPGQSDELKSLLARCHHVLSGLSNSLVSQSDELESIASMLEAEPVIWPEDVERMRTLVERIRRRASLESDRSAPGRGD